MSGNQRITSRRDPRRAAKMFENLAQNTGTAEDSAQSTNTHLFLKYMDEIAARLSIQPDANVTSTFLEEEEESGTNKLVVLTKTFHLKYRPETPIEHAKFEQAVLHTLAVASNSIPDMVWLSDIGDGVYCFSANAFFYSYSEGYVASPAAVRDFILACRDESLAFQHAFALRARDPFDLCPEAFLELVKQDSWPKLRDELPAGVVFNRQVLVFVRPVEYCDMGCMNIAVWSDVLDEITDSLDKFHCFAFHDEIRKDAPFQKAVAERERACSVLMNMPRTETAKAVAKRPVRLWDLDDGGRELKRSKLLSL